MLIADGLATNREAAKNLAQDMRKTELRDYLYAKTPAQFFAQLDGGGFGMIPLPDNFGDGHVLPDLSTEEIFSDPNNHNQFSDSRYEPRRTFTIYGARTAIRRELAWVFTTPER